MSLEDLFENEAFTMLFINNNMSIIDVYDNIMFISDNYLPSNSGLYLADKTGIYKFKEGEQLVKISFPEFTVSKVNNFIKKNRDTYRA